MDEQGAGEGRSRENGERGVGWWVFGWTDGWIEEGGHQLVVIQTAVIGAGEA